MENAEQTKKTKKETTNKMRKNRGRERKIVLERWYFIVMLKYFLFVEDAEQTKKQQKWQQTRCEKTEEEKEKSFALFRKGQPPKKTWYGQQMVARKRVETMNKPERWYCSVMLNIFYFWKMQISVCKSN